MDCVLVRRVLAGNRTLGSDFALPRQVYCVLMRQ